MAIGVGVTTKATTTGATSVTSAGATTTTGSTVFVGVHCRSPGQGVTISSVADNKSNTYTEVTGSPIGMDTDFSRGYLYKCENITGGSGHTFTTTVNTSTEIVMVVIEITGAATSSIDSHNEVLDTSSPFASGATGTTAQAAELVLGYIANNSGSNPATIAVSNATPSSGWTIPAGSNEQDGASLWPAGFAYVVVSSTGTYQSSFTASGATQAAVYTVTVKEASAGVSAALTGSAATSGNGTQAPGISIGL